MALLSSVEYESEALLLPEIKNNQSEAQNLLNTYGGLLGIGSSASSSGEGTISPTVYPKIVGSLSFQNNLLNSELYIPRLDSTMTGYIYFEHFHAPVARIVWDYTLGLPGTIAGKRTSHTATAGLPPAIRDQLGEGTFELTQEQLAVVKRMRDRVSISIDAETGVLHVSALMPDPVIAAQVCKKVITMLKSYLTEYSTQKAKENLDYVESQQQQAQLRFQDAQNRLAKFHDQNVNLNTAKALTQEQRLQAKFDLANNLYNTVSQRLMQAQMQVQDQKPVFKVLQSANIPVEKSQPQRVLILVIAFMAGLAVSFLFIAGKLIKKNWMTGA